MLNVHRLGPEKMSVQTSAKQEHIASDVTLKTLKIKAVLSIDCSLSFLLISHARRTTVWQRSLISVRIIYINPMTNVIDTKTNL